MSANGLHSIWTIELRVAMSPSDLQNKPEVFKSSLVVKRAFWKAIPKHILPQEAYYHWADGMWTPKESE